MANFYPNYFAHKPLIFSLLILLPVLASAHVSGGPTNPDSLANRGHCKAVVEIDTLCATHEIVISAFVYWTFTGVHQPVVGSWSNGLVAHKITVEPPGTWSWDPTGTTCEEYHWGNEVTFNMGFFDGPVDLTAPTAICPVDDYVEINNNLNYYSFFTSLVWSPPNPAGDFEPYPVTEPGTYGITVVDAFNCMTSDQVTIVEVPIFSPPITGPARLCPEGDTGTISIVNPAQYESFQWDNGETTSPITVNDPGIYQVTATDSHGCTGVGAISIPSGEVGPFDISVSSPTLCPGLVDTLQVVGGFANYSWSNNVMGITNIVNQAGTYTVTVTNFSGCTATLSATVTALLPPPIQVLGTPLCLGDTAVLTTIGGNFPQYHWSSGQTTQSITASTPGIYSVTVSGTGICTTSTSTVLDYAAAPTTVIDSAAALNCLVPQTTLNGGNSSTGPTFPFVWTTPDGHFVSGDSTLNPTVDQPGTYILSIVNNATGCITSDTLVVKQDIAPPAADAGPPASLNCVVQSFAIGPVPMPVDTHLLPVWSTLNGNILSGSNSWAPSVNQPGTYILLVTNALNGCTSTASVVIEQDIAVPTAQIAPTNLITCMQGTVPLDGSGSSSGLGFTHLWSTVNGLLAGPADTLIAGASSIGTYTLVVTNTSNGCSASATVSVAADVNIPIVGALLPDTLTCVVLNTVIDASTSSSGPTFQYQWTTADGNILSGGNTLMPSVDAPGTYTLNLINTANNCSATLAVMVNQDTAPPVAHAGLNLLLNCTAPTTVLDGSASSTGANFTYNWTTSDGNIVSNANALNPTVDREGTYILQVTNLENGCSATASVMIMKDANAPVAFIAAPATLTCTTLQTIIDATSSTQTGNLSFVWSGNILSGQGSLQAAINQPGDYTLSITNLSNGCSDVATVTVVQDTVPPVVLAGPNVLINCYNPTGNIGDLNNPSGPGFVLQWNTTGGSFISPTNGTLATIDQAGDYQLLITNTQNGCTSTDDVMVTEDFAAPIADAGPTAELTCAQTSLMLQGIGSAGANFNYLWTATAGGNITGGANAFTPSINAPGTYNLLVTNTQNGCTSTSQVNITENANGPVASTGAPQTLTCTFTSTNLSAAGSSTGSAFTYAWSTINGNITAGANTFTPSIAAPGAYTVTVTNTINLCTETASVTILQDIQSPVVNAGADNLLNCVITSLGLEAQTVSSSSQNIGFQWSTSNGEILNGANTASPIIGAPGTYVVTVTDIQNGCTGMDQLQIGEDFTPPLVLLANPDTLNCAISQITIDALACTLGAQFQYEWTSSAGGNLVSTQNQQLPIVDAGGVYTLVVTNTVNGCSQSASVTVTKDVQLPTVEAGNTAELDCDTQTLTLDATASSQGPNYTYTWSTANGQIIGGGNTLTPSIGDPGDYVLSILNTENGCLDLDNVNVTENVVPPVLTIAPPQTLTCTNTSATLLGSGTALGNPTSIVWATSNGNIVSGGASLTPIVDAPGNYTLTVTNPANGCSSSLPVAVLEDIQIPAVQVQPASLLTCSVLQFPLQSTVPAQANVLWTTVGGHIVSGANTPNPIVDEPGLYLLSITSAANGCSNSAQVIVQEEMNVPNGLQFNLLPPLCNGTPGQLTVDQVEGGVGPFAYSIDGGQTYYSAIQFSNLTPGSYALVVQDANGCELMKPIDVPSPPIPLVTAPPAFEIEMGENQEIMAHVPPPFPLSLVDTVIWNPMTGLTFEGNSILELLNPVAQPFATTQYTVTIFTKEGCKSEARTLVRVDRQVDIYAPNVIRPDDSDGDNNTFLLFARDASVALIKKLQIFDRWGSLIFVNEDFRPNDVTAGWSGDYRGEPVNPAVFVWWAELELVDGREVLIKGDVTVVR